MNYEGFIERISTNQIAGWVYDRDKPDEPVKLEIFLSGTLLDVVSADKYRADLSNAGKGDGRHGFYYNFNKSIDKSDLKNIKIKISGTNIRFDNQNTLIAFNKKKKGFAFLKSRLEKIIELIGLDFNMRNNASYFYINGEGIEIGALHYPLWVKKKVKVRYVDRISREELHKQYPDMDNLVSVDIIDNGEKLENIKDDSLDFIICNHMLEHCKNPLGTVRNHLNKIKSKGVLYYTVPDKRFTFDKERELTNFEHLVLDDKNEGNVSHYNHYYEWVRYCGKIEDEAMIKERIESLIKINYSIHFHTWELYSFLDFLNKSKEYLGNIFEMELFQFNKEAGEIITILRKI